MDLRKKLEHVASAADIDAIMDDIAALKRDVSKALERIKNTALDGALDSAQDIADDLGDDVAELYKDLSKKGRRTAKVVGQRVEEQPIASLLLAFSAGFILSKI